ncbi:hypothetical protein EVAR_96761_1 [Eumeta japonica]|uniref:Uncharacterized protein n=1 Tax=Eumeta variegata TaxID=151549 RepID=A0A4C1WUY3_EUMVA|nr:hypothetical protein EVAR_96761_1 [Eumeta japonica]
MKASEQTNDGARTPCAGATAAVQVDDAIASTATLDWIDFVMCVSGFIAAPRRIDCLAALPAQAHHAGYYL